jgi:hypothetical protein
MEVRDRWITLFLADNNANIGLCPAITIPPNRGTWAVTCKTHYEHVSDFKMFLIAFVNKYYIIPHSTATKLTR